MTAGAAGPFPLEVLRTAGRYRLYGGRAQAAFDVPPPRLLAKAAWVAIMPFWLAITTLSLEARAVKVRVNPLPGARDTAGQVRV